MTRTARLDPETLLSAYAQGVFPMGDADGRIRWYTADPRGILPLETFHVPRTLRPLLRRPPGQGGYELRINCAFEAVMRGCMEQRVEGTWINEPLIKAYVRLHGLGFAHSVESWFEGELAGGLYGVSLGGAFFGESMFHRRTDASKVALCRLVDRLRQREYELLDTQASTPHLLRFGCVQVPADQYLSLLRRAIQKPCRFD